MGQWLRLCASNARGPGSISGQETRFHMPQLKISNAATKKTKDSSVKQINNILKIKMFKIKELT